MAGMVVKNNMSALNTLNMLNTNHSQLSKSLAKVSSGMRINGAADDASGYAISERMRAQIRGLEQDNRNTQNGNSLLKVAEGAVSSTVDILKTLKEKVINAANDTNTDEDRATIQKELDQSIDQINDNANVTYNGKYLVDGTKNSQGSATYTALTNKSLSTSTGARTALTDLASRTDENLGILSTDNVTVSYVQNGKTYTTTFSVGTNTLQDIFIKAEDVDLSGQTFADQSNLSAASAINYPAVPSLDSLQQQKIAKENAMYQAYADLNGTFTAANGTTYTDSTYGGSGAQGAYNTASSAASSAKGTALSSLGTWSSLMTTGANGSAPGGRTFYSIGNALGSTFYNRGYTDNDVINALNTFRQTEVPDPNTVQAGASGSATDILYQAMDEVSPSSASPFNQIAGAWSTYQTDYSAYTSAKSALSTATGDLSTAQQAYNQAKSDYDAMFGPALVTNYHVGLDKNGNIVDTATHENAITVTSNNSGVNGQIAGLTISITDSEGNVRKTANASLDAFNETIRAENESKNDNSIVLQTGTKANQSIKVALTDMRSEALGLKGSDGSTLNIGTQKKANAAINVLENAIQKALDEQTKIGSIQSRLEYTAANLTTATENVQASESAIRDADMAKEMTEYTKNNVLLQTSQSMLAQANQSSSNVLGLLA